MRLVLFTCLLIIAVATTSAQQQKESVPPVSPSPREDPSHVIYNLEVSPAGEPRPAMKYRLLPNPADLKPGNAATQYYKAYALESELPIRAKAFEKIEEWRTTANRDLDIGELGKTLELLRDDAFYRSIRSATNRAACDWEEPLEEEGVHLLLPAMQSLRSVARLLSMKARYEIALRKYDEAILTCRDNFTLGYHLQHDGKLVVQSLVGIAIIGSIMHEGELLEWIQSPGSPNLYWALSEIPPYYDSRQVIANDLRLVEYTLPLLREIGERVLAPDEAVELATRAFTVEADRRLKKEGLERGAGLAVWALQAYDESYRELSETGFSKELLDRMPALQVALLGRWQRYQHARDDLYKWAVLAYGPARELALRKQNETLQKVDQTVAPFDVFLPALAPMYRAQLRQHRFLSALRAIEALRLYAARHGRWPEALADIRDVPVPDDPVTNAPFVYQASDNNATLILVEHRLGSGMEYEYRLRLRDEK
jgi:hypothetical protein